MLGRINKDMLFRLAVISKYSADGCVFMAIQMLPWRDNIDVVKQKWEAEHRSGLWSLLP